MGQVACSWVVHCDQLVLAVLHDLEDQHGQQVDQHDLEDQHDQLEVPHDLEDQRVQLEDLSDQLVDLLFLLHRYDLLGVLLVVLVG